MALSCWATDNHSYHPNARYKRDFMNKIMKYIALRDIEAGEEITIAASVVRAIRVGKIERESKIVFNVIKTSKLTTAVGGFRKKSVFR